MSTPAKGSTVESIQARLLDEVRNLELATVLSAPNGRRTRADEFEGIVRDLFWRMFRNRRALKLIDRCSVDHPELASVWCEQGR